MASEPVSEALLPVYNQLQTLKRCLLEVKKQGGVSSVRDLYPYSMKVFPYSPFPFSFPPYRGSVRCIMGASMLLYPTG